MSELIAIGASHKTAGVAVRERIALTAVGAERLMRELVEEPEIQEAVVLSTCNRTELYLVVGRRRRGRDRGARPPRPPRRRAPDRAARRASTRCATATPRGICTA